MFELRLARLAQTVQITGIQHPQCLRTGFFDPPAKLFFNHESIEQDNIRRQVGEPGIKCGIIRLHRVRADAQQLKIQAVLRRTRGRSKADSIARRKQRTNDIFSPPPRSSRAGLRPNLTNYEAMHRAWHLVDDPATTKENPFQVHLQLARVRRIIDRIGFRD